MKGNKKEILQALQIVNMMGSSALYVFCKLTEVKSN